MSYFSEWEQIVTKVLVLIKDNKELLKYTCDPSGSPQDSAIPSWDKILMTNVFPVPKDPLSVNTQKAFINAYVSSSYPYDDNPYFREDYLNIEVACHLEVWMLDNGRIRPYVICSLIDEMLNNRSIPELSIQKVLNYGAKVTKFGDMYYGYRIVYKLSNAGAIDCNG